MKELKCTNCGAALTPDGKCEYCGSRFRIDGEIQPMLFRIENPKAVPLVCETLIDKRMVAEFGDVAAERAKHDMAYKMAAHLERCMEMSVSDDPILDAVRVRGKIRVVLPGVEL